MRIARDYLEHSGELDEPAGANRFLLSIIDSLARKGEHRTIMLANRAIEAYRHRNGFARKADKTLHTGEDSMNDKTMTDQQRDEIKRLCHEADVPDKSGELLTQEGAEHFIRDLKKQLAERK